MWQKVIFNGMSAPDKNNIAPEAIAQARQFLIQHFGAKEDAELGGLSVIHHQGWIIDAKNQGWKLSEILAAFKNGPAGASQ